MPPVIVVSLPRNVSGRFTFLRLGISNTQFMNEKTTFKNEVMRAIETIAITNECGEFGQV